MSSAEILSLISTISFVIATISLVLAVFFWFYFKIPAVIGDLSGRTAKKSIARIRISNERAGGQGYRPSATNVDRGMLTDTMQHSKKKKAEEKPKTVTEGTQKTVVRKISAEKAQTPETELLEENKAKMQPDHETELLATTEATEMLVDGNETVPLSEETTLLAQQTGSKKFTMLDEVVLTNTDEVIV